MGAKNFIYISIDLVMKGKKEKIKQGREDSFFYPVRNNAPLLPPGQRPSGPEGAAGLDFRIIPGSAP